MGDPGARRLFAHRAHRAARRMTGRPLLLASVLIAVVAGVWFAVNFVHPTGPLILLWVPAPLSLMLAAYACWPPAASASLPPPTRRFWRQFCVACLLVAFGTVSQAYDTFGGPTIGQHIGPVTLGFYSAGILTIIWAMYRLPLGVHTAGARLRIGLDAGTVVLATAVFLWHFRTRPLLEQGADLRPSILASGVAMVLALVAVFAMAKVIMSGSAFVDRDSLRLLALAVTVGALGEIPQSYIPDKPHMLGPQLTIPTIAILAVLAAQRQWRSAAGGSGRAAAQPVRRRPYSVLPYVAVAAVDTLLVALAGTGRYNDLAVVSVTAVALTAIVILRQLTAFQDNGRLLRQLDHNATHDALTHLPNRALFQQRLQDALEAGEPTRRVCVALIDLNDFKLVNDTLGHAVGDALLVALAPRLVATIRSRGTVARLGGDEFVVVFDDITTADIDPIARRMIDALSPPVIADGHELVVRASIGLADGGTGDDASELLRRADVAMYAAKTAGKNAGTSTFARFSQELSNGAQNRATLTAELDQAIVENELFVLYQPIVTLDGDEMLAVEALVRWHHPTLGTLPPGEFIPVAERTGLIIPLGRWIMEQGCRQLAAWAANPAGGPRTLHVNVSAVQLQESTFADQVAALLAETGVAAERLVLEITETAVAGLGSFSGTLHALRRLGVRIAFDDFGTAQSTLSLLENCPVDLLKLDQSFVQRVLSGQRSMAAAVMHLGRALGLSVVAEGVETQQQADQLRTLGYEAAQGFHFAPPMTAAEIGELLARRQSRELAA